MLAALLAVALQDARPIDPLVFVPEDALLVASLTDLDALRARAADSAWVRLVNDPSFAPLLALLDEVTPAEVSPDAAAKASADSPSFQDPRNWWSALHGSLEAFVVGDPGEASALYGAWIELRGDRAALDALVHDSFAHTAAEAGVDRSGVGVRIHRLDAPSGPPSYVFSFECAGWLGFVAGRERERALAVALAAIDRATDKDSARGFAANAGLGRARATLEHGRSLEVFFDLGRSARETFEKRAAEGERQLRIMRRLGLLDGWIHAAADVGQGENFDGTLSFGFDPTGLLAGLEHVLGPLPIDLLRFAPEESLSVALGRIDVAGLWKAISAAVKELDETSYTQMTQGLEQVRTLTGIDVEQDVLRRVPGSFLIFTTHAPVTELAQGELEPAAAPDEDELARAVARAQGIGTAALVALDEASDLGDMVDSLSAKFGLAAGVSTSEFRGHTIHSPATGSRWSFTDEALVFGNALTPLHTLIERLEVPGTSSKAKDERFHAALERNRNAAVLSIADTAQGVEAMFTFARVLLDFAVQRMPDETGVVARIRAALPDGSAAEHHLDGVITRALVAAPDHLALRISGH